VLASNLANADTPNYKARDFNFKAALDQATSGSKGGGSLPLLTDNSRQLQAPGTVAGGVHLQYRVPNQPSLDGNTVDSQQEKASFAQNAVQYQAALTFLSGRIKGLMGAIKGD
ncbi:MAG TPA: flagellar basal body rod protein FlgB, partial [Gammaproteobacteria bacterium]|nr:flagellar basal body rod protein FlgB [Gammaproteobacteria bacterium]